MPVVNFSYYLSNFVAASRWVLVLLCSPHDAWSWYTSGVPSSTKLLLQHPCYHLCISVSSLEALWFWKSSVFSTTGGHITGRVPQYFMKFVIRFSLNCSLASLFVVIFDFFIVLAKSFYFCPALFTSFLDAISIQIFESCLYTWIRHGRWHALVQFDTCLYY